MRLGTLIKKDSLQDLKDTIYNHSSFTDRVQDELQSDNPAFDGSDAEIKCEGDYDNETSTRFLRTPQHQKSGSDCEALDIVYKEDEEYQNDDEIGSDVNGANPQQAPSLSKSKTSVEWISTPFNRDEDDNQEITACCSTNLDAKSHSKNEDISHKAASKYRDARSDPSDRPLLVAPSPWFIGRRRHQSIPGLVCCMFPWISNVCPVIQVPDCLGKDSGGLGSFKEFQQDDDEGEGDSSSTSANVNEMGEKLSDHDRQAVLARLRLLCQPEVRAVAEASGCSPFTTEADVKLSYAKSKPSLTYQLRNYEDGLLNGIPVFDVSMLNGRRRGILKNSATDNLISSAISPGYCGRAMKSVRFAPMARAMLVPSLKEMTIQEKADIWWQRQDYEYFRHTGRIISRGMSQHTDIGTAKSSAGREDDMNPTDDDECKDNWTETKWWHKYGHSRRGLEHVVSVDEGRQRQLNVRAGIRAILNEQTRQAWLREFGGIDETAESVGCLDERLREVYLHHTRWARDLALASGASDEDAVRREFSTNRRSRDFYLHQLSRSNSCPTTTKLSSSEGGSNIKSFADVKKTTESLVSPFTQKDIQVGKDSSSNESLVKLMLFSVESTQPVEKEFEQDHSLSWQARKAASYSAIDGIVKVNIASVLAGMDDLEEF